MLISKNKRAKDGPAILVMKPDLQNLMDINVKKIRPQWAARDEDHLFVTVEGKGFPEGTIGWKKVWIFHGNSQSSKGQKIGTCQRKKIRDHQDKAFKSFPSLPSTTKIRGVLQKDAKLFEIMNRERWEQLYTKIKNIFKKKIKKINGINSVGSSSGRKHEPGYPTPGECPTNAT